MMMEKPAEACETTDEKSVEEPTLSIHIEDTTDDREKDIERRLAMLGDDSNTNIHSMEEDVDENCEQEEFQTNKDDDSFAPVQDEPLIGTTEEVKNPKNEPSLPPSSMEVKPKVEEQITESKASSVAAKPKENALLARIMAAQERAKQAQMKQAAQQMSQPVAPTSTQSEKEKMLDALNGMSLNEMKKATAATKVEHPVQKSSLPPSFEIFEKQIKEQEIKKAATAKPPPPSFDSISMDMLQPETTGAPFASAPPVEDHANQSVAPPSFDLLGGFTPMAPPPTATMNEAQPPPPPAFEEAMQFNAPSLDDTIDFDLEGSGMTQEEKQKMIEEQRAIMEQIQREAMNNKASVAAIKADAFASRMTGNPQGQTGGVDGFSASEVEEQRRIYEQIQKEAKGMNANSSSEGATTVDIGGGQHVNIHGQEKTQESIREGTAVLVECLNCNNWMQVAENATLMFCPICSVVSPVVKGDHDMQVAHLTQMEEDRKLAEQLQKEESEAYRQSSSNRRSATSRAAPVVEGSWWDSLSKGMNNAMVAMGVVADEENDPAHMSVSRPPGAVSPGQRSLHAATTGEEGSEREGLLQAEGGNYDYRRREARVAQSQPLFSCIVDSVANTASAVSSAVYGDDDDEVHGVDSSPLFAVPKTGRDRNAGGSYHALPDDS